MMQSEQTAELSAALAKAQAVMKAAAFNKINPHFKNKYADLAAVLDAIRKPLADNGLSITQTTEVRDQSFVLVTTLHHSTGQWIAGEYPLPIGVTPQQLGSALTYARRYTLSSLACIAADEDDDAEGVRKENQVLSVPAMKINAEQLAALIDALDEVDADKAKFCSYLKIKSLADLPASRLSEATAAIESKRSAA